MVLLTFSDQQPTVLCHAIAFNYSSPRENIRNLFNQNMAEILFTCFQLWKEYSHFLPFSFALKITWVIHIQIGRKNWEENFFGCLQTTTVCPPIYNRKQKKSVCQKKTSANGGPDPAFTKLVLYEQNLVLAHWIYVLISSTESLLFHMSFPPATQPISRLRTASPRFRSNSSS